MTEKRPINTKLIAQLIASLQRERNETELMRVWAGDSGAHITKEGLLELSPMTEWIWEDRKSDEVPHRARVMADGVAFYAIFTDEEKAEALGETDETLDREATR